GGDHQARPDERLVPARGGLQHRGQGAPHPLRLAGLPPRTDTAAQGRPCRSYRESAGHSSSERSIQAYFSWVCRRWVSRSTVGSSPASSAILSTLRAVRHTASLPSTSCWTMPFQSGTPSAPC